MYTRLNSRRMPSMVVITDNDWTISSDKSCILIKGTVTEDGSIDVSPIATNRHAVHVYRNPALGAEFQIITPDDGQVDLPRPTKSKMKDAHELAWHYKVFIVRVDLPSVGE